MFEEELGIELISGSGTKKLTMEEINTVLYTAMDKHNKVPTMRFGQCLYINLPEHIRNAIYNTDKDFFYWTDNKKVYDVLWKELVNGCC